MAISPPAPRVPDSILEPLLDGTSNMPTPTTSISSTTTIVDGKPLAPILNTPRTILTLYDPSSTTSDDDDAAIVTLFNDPKIIEQIGDFGIRDIKDWMKLREAFWLREWNDGNAKHESGQGDVGRRSDSDSDYPMTGGYSGMALWMIRERISATSTGDGSKRAGGSSSAADDQLGAYIGLVTYRCVLSVPDIGYILGPEFWGKGYATETAAQVLRYAREEMGIKRLCGATRSGHRASVRVLEKIGLVHVGRGNVGLGDGELKEGEVLVLPEMVGERAHGGWVLERIFKTQK